MCLSCRERAEQHSLIRISRVNGEFVVNSLLDSKRVGRGAYLHPHKECISHLLHEKSLSRAFRESVSKRSREELQLKLEEQLQLIERFQLGEIV